MTSEKEGTGSAVSCLDIFSGDIDAYILNCRSHSKDSTRIFFHLPKTGGTSIRIAMEKELPNFLNINRYSDLEKWGDILKTQMHTPYDMIAGHLRFGALRELYETGSRVSTITFLREPKSRILSQYRYMVSPKYPNSADFKEKFENFEKFVTAGVGNNPVIRTLLGGECGNLDQVLEKASRNFMFIGLTEYSTLHSFLAQACLGFDTFHVPGRDNTTVATKENRIELDDSLSAILEEKCALDIAFYQAMKERHLAIIDEVSKAFLSRVLGDHKSLPFLGAEAG